MPPATMTPSSPFAAMLTEEDEEEDVVPRHANLLFFGVEDSFIHRGSMAHAQGRRWHLLVCVMLDRIMGDDSVGSGRAFGFRSTVYGTHRRSPRRNR